MMMRLLNFRIISIVADHWARTQTKLPVRIYRDEDANYNLTGLEESKGLVENLKMGLSVCISTQVPDWNDDTINANVLQGCVQKVWLQSQPPVSELAATYMRASLNHYMVHHVDETQKNLIVGHDKEVRKGSSKSSDGKKTKSEMVVKSPRHQTIRETKTTYVTLSDQSILSTVKIETLPIGTAIITDGTKVVERQFPGYTDYGVFEGFSDAALSRQMKFLESVHLLRRPSPQDFELPACPTNSPQPSGNQAPSKSGGTAMS